MNEMVRLVLLSIDDVEYYNLKNPIHSMVLDRVLDV